MKNGNHETTDPVIINKFPSAPVKVEEFLLATPPFDMLPLAELQGLAAAVKIINAKKNTLLKKIVDFENEILVIHAGIIIKPNSQGIAEDSFGPGDCLASILLPAGRAILTDGLVTQESILYVIPRQFFEDLLDKHPQFTNYFDHAGENTAVGSLLSESEKSSELQILASPLRSLLRDKLLLLDERSSIRNVAMAMDRDKLDNVLLVNKDRLTGILTDQDIRSRVVALGRSYDDPVATVMTTNPATLDVSELGIAAVLLVARLGINHIPILEDGNPIGVINAKSLSKSPTNSVSYLVREAQRRHTIPELKEIAEQIPSLLLELTKSWVPAQNIGHLISSVTDALNIRLLQLAEKDLGPPPINYNWVVVGSLGRCEQTAVSDQDNFILLDNNYDEAEHGVYFSKLAKKVCSGMNELGFIYCPGGIMAKTDMWRQPLKIWKNYFRKWIEEPEPKALMLSSVFFDLRLLYGKKKLFKKLSRFITERSNSNRIYLAHLAANALTSQPALGFFNNFSLERGGTHHRTLNLKLAGVTPIVDLARIYALSAGTDPINTVKRLQLAAEQNILSREGSRDLLDALELISITRLRYQARLIQEQKPVNNYMSPKLLSNMEQEHLKDAFAVTQTMQSALRQHFQTNFLG